MTKRKRRPNLFKSVLRFFAFLIILADILVPVAVIVPQLGGYVPFAVVSASMAPAIPVGSMVYVSYAEPETIQPGEVITFYMNVEAETTTTHRVVENDTQKKAFVTKGDANEKVDIVPIPYSSVLGRVIFTIPVLGFILLGINLIYGKIMYVASFVMAVVLLALTR